MFLISPAQRAEPMPSELIDTTAFKNVAPGSRVIPEHLYSPRLEAPVKSASLCLPLEIIWFDVRALH